MGASGSAVLDFGAFPGTSDASIAVAGQAGILGTSRVEAYIEPADSADHSADEHMVETLKVFADRSTIIAGTGFTIKGFNASQQNSIAGDCGKGTLIWGRWNVGWVWL